MLPKRDTMIISCNEASKYFAIVQNYQWHLLVVIFAKINHSKFVEYNFRDICRNDFLLKVQWAFVALSQSCIQFIIKYIIRHYPSSQQFAIFSAQVPDFIQIMCPSTRRGTLFNVDVERIKMAADCSGRTWRGRIRWYRILMYVETVRHIVHVPQLKFNDGLLILMLFKISRKMETSIYIWWRHFVPPIYGKFS